MTKTDKKMAVLACLQAESKPAKIAVIREKLEDSGHSCSERSLRRWLSELIDEHKVSKAGQKKATVYFLAGAPSPAPSSVFSASLSSLLSQIRRPLFQRDPVGYNAKWLANYQPNVTYYLSSEQLSLLRGASATNIEPAGTFARRVYSRLLVDLSYNSSRLEGNTYSLLDTEKLLVEGLANQEKMDEEKVMILNHKEAIRYLVENASKLTLDSTTIRTLHYLLSDGLMPANLSGQLRQESVRIGGSTYMPMEGQEKIGQLLDTLLQKAQMINDAFEQSFYILVHLSYLQTFSDVNKRTARLAANIPLIKNNLCPLSFNDVERDDYLSATLAVYELNDPRLLAELYCHSYLRTQKQYINLVDNSFDETRVRYRAERRELLRQLISQGLVGDTMRSHIQTYCREHVPEEVRADFEEDLQQDIDTLSPAKLVGLGITKEELATWQAML